MRKKMRVELQDPARRAKAKTQLYSERISSFQCHTAVSASTAT